MWHTRACARIHTHARSVLLFLSLSSRLYVFLMVISAMKQTNEGHKKRSGDGWWGRVFGGGTVESVMGGIRGRAQAGNSMVCLQN